MRSVVAAALSTIGTNAPFKVVYPGLPEWGGSLPYPSIYEWHARPPAAAEISVTSVRVALGTEAAIEFVRASEAAPPGGRRAITCAVTLEYAPFRAGLCLANSIVVVPYWAGDPWHSPGVVRACHKLGADYWRVCDALSHAASTAGCLARFKHPRDLALSVAATALSLRASAFDATFAREG